MDGAILYEVNTRVWLRELSECEGRTLTLADVPDLELKRWQKLGFTHIWLMGVWQIGPNAREVAVRFWREHWSKEFPSNMEDVLGSPYAIEEYSVDSRLGDSLSVLMLKERLSRLGIRLILDFVPNHFGIDSKECVRFPSRFVHSDEPRPGTFESEVHCGKRFFAHGRDPYFDPWIDTVQIDYRVLETHQAMRSLAQTISMYGDGLRCDMAMLLLPEIFSETWKNFPPPGAHLTNADFWKKTIQEIRQLQPQVQMIAEVYWDREEQLQELGFDYTYNKRVCDYLVRKQFSELVDFLSSRTTAFLNRSMHFIENHDEGRAASTFEFAEHQLAAATILFLPGMALLHDGQLEGRKAFARIQITKRTPEEADSQIASFYQTLLLTLQQTEVRRGKPSLLKVQSDQPVLAVQWTGAEHSDLALVNFDTQPARIPMRVMKVLYSTAAPQILADHVLLAPNSAVIVRLQPT